MNRFLFGVLGTFFISNWASTTDRDGLDAPESMAQSTDVTTDVFQGIAQQEDTIELDKGLLRCQLLLCLQH